MQPLEYETPRRAARPSAALFVLPAIATCLAIYLAHYDADEEPFMIFSARDAAKHLGIPLVSLGLWLYWGMRARREKLSALAVVPLVIFAVLQLWFTASIGMSYFSDAHFATMNGLKPQATTVPAATTKPSP
jgi:hypothetical protein